MVVGPAGRWSVLDWSPVSHSPPTPSLQPPPPAASFLGFSPGGPNPSLWPPSRQFSQCPRGTLSPGRSASPSSPCARRRPRLQCQQAAAGWRRRQVGERAVGLGPGSVSVPGGRDHRLWLPAMRPAAAYRTHHGAGFSRLPAPSKQLQRDWGGPPRLLMPATHSTAPFLPLPS